MKTLTPAYAAVFLLAGLGIAFPALATSPGSTGPQELGEEALAAPAPIDVFRFRCPGSPPKTVSAQAKVEDLPPLNTSALMRVKLVKDHKAALAEDFDPSSNSGEGSTSSPSPSEPAVLARGPGKYLMLFYKTAAGKEKYRGSVVCKRSSGPDYLPDLTNTQDQ